MTTRMFEDLELGDRLPGEREYGTVWRARQRSRNCEVAVHLIERTRVDVAARVRGQMEDLAQFKDDHVVQTLGAGTRDGKLFCVTEWPEGEDLESQIRRGQRFTTEDILHIAEGAARALRAAWKRGIVHGGIRPASLYLLPDGRVKLGDFGLGSLFGALAHEPTPLPVTAMYLSPEQGLGRAADTRSDIYSLGAVLYELAAGRAPFEGYDSATSLIFQVVHVEPALPRQLGSSIPRELERVILRCLAKAPEERYANPQELLDDLEQVRKAMSSSRLPGIDVESDTGDFDIYEDQVIGEGGMGILLRGRQRSLDRSVAIKVIREAFLNQAEFVQRFRREAELLAQLDHPNVVHVFGTGMWKGRFFYAMELVRGEDLSSRQKRGHRFTCDEILHVAEGVAQALRAAWRHKIVHRDIKPSNIMITPEGVVKTADFGLAKSLRIPGTESKIIAGTVEYLSPEQGMGRPVDIRSDLYSLGIVLYELAAGVHPFRSAASSIAMIYQHVHTPAPPLDGPEVADFPVALRAIIQRCLCKKPEDRFQSPDEFLEAIRALRNENPAALKSTRRFPAPRRSRRLWLAGAALVLAVGGALILREARSPGRPETSWRPAYELALGLGDTAEAMRIAERHLGPESPEYRAAAKQRLEQLYREGCQSARAKVEARDWKGAIQVYEDLQRTLGEEHKPEVKTALQFCRDLQAAREAEERADWAEAARLYQKHMGSSSLHQDYLKERLEAARQKLQPR